LGVDARCGSLARLTGAAARKEVQRHGQRSVARQQVAPAQFDVGLSSAFASQP
jgi:hypothetical protein